MEQWEIELRDKLEKELPLGGYKIRELGGMVLWTGRGGKIELEVAFMNSVRNFLGMKPTDPLYPIEHRDFLKPKK